MIITVDTAKDSPEELLRIARLLEEMAGKERTITRDIPSDEVDPEVQGELFGVLDATVEVSGSESEKKSTSSDKDDFEVVPY